MHRRVPQQKVSGTLSIKGFMLDARKCKVLDALAWSLIVWRGKCQSGKVLPGMTAPCWQKGRPIS
jgi:hypothetical protein